MIAEINPRRKSAINRHGVVTPRRVSALRDDMKAIQSELDQLQQMMEAAKLDEDEPVKIDGAMKWDAAKEAAASYLRNVKLAVVQLSLDKLRQEARTPRLAS